MAEAIKSGSNLIQFYKDKLTERNFYYPPVADTHLSTLKTYTSETNTHLINLSGSLNTITNDENAITNADRTIAENTQSLTKLKNGADPLDLETAQLTVTQRTNALMDAKDQLAYYSLRAPFDGTVASISVKKFDSAGSGAAVATFITNQQFAELSLNEVDAAKIKAGQKATLTFDAVDGLTLTDKVAVVDPAGTVSQGVVTYRCQLVQSKAKQVAVMC